MAVVCGVIVAGFYAWHLWSFYPSGFSDEFTKMCDQLEICALFFSVLRFTSQRFAHWTSCVPASGELIEGLTEHLELVQVMSGTMFIARHAFLPLAGARIGILDSLMIGYGVLLIWKVIRKKLKQRKMQESQTGLGTLSRDSMDPSEIER